MAGVQERVTTELRSFTELAQLECRGPFDCIFSNFAGLNCTGELQKVLLILLATSKTRRNSYARVVTEILLVGILTSLQGKIQNSSEENLCQTRQKGKSRR